MFGFDFEGDDGVAEIAGLAKEIHKKTRMQINLSANVFIPKPFCELESLPMQSMSELINKKMLILKRLGSTPGIKTTISHIERSILEAVFSRGDRRLGEVLYQAFLRGACFDSYSDHLNLSCWTEAFAVTGIKKEDYLIPRESYPWSHIQVK
jgi:radical SAM superfamily enzyme YgiQ (UPF0313 family)